MIIHNHHNKHWQRQTWVLQIFGEKTIPPRYKNIYSDGIQTWTYLRKFKYDVVEMYRVNNDPYYEIIMSSQRDDLIQGDSVHQS